MNVPSLDNPPTAPKKVVRKSLPTLRIIKPLSLPSTPPLPAPRKAKPTKERNLSPIPLDWGLSNVMSEVKFLTERGDVRPKFLRYSPEDIAEETDFELLYHLWELYFPPGQPHNHYEETYLRLMRDCIDMRLAELSM